MRYRDLLKMDGDLYINRLLDAAYDSIDHPEEELYYLGYSRGHSSIHYKVDNVALFSRMWKEHLPTVSCFTDEQTAREAISDAIAYKAKDIYRWFSQDQPSDRNDFFFNNFSFTVDMRTEEPIGYGMDAGLNTYASNGVRFVLERDFSGKSPFGFYLKTAYPEISQESFCTRGSKKFSLDEIETEAESREISLFRDDFERVAAVLKYDPEFIKNKVSVSHFESDGEFPRQVVMHKQEGEAFLDMYVKENGCRVFERTVHGRRSLSLDEMFKKYPEASHFLVKALQERDKAIESKRAPREKSDIKYFTPR